MKPETSTENPERLTRIGFMRLLGANVKIKMNDHTIIVICLTIALIAICITICSIRSTLYKERWNVQTTERYKIAMANGYEQRGEILENEEGRKCKTEYWWVKPKSA